MIALALCLAGLPAAEPQMRVGAAQADITPIVGLGEPDVWLAGYQPGRRAVGVLSPLMACGVTVFDGRTRVAIVSVDLIGLFYDEVVALRTAYKAAHPDRPIDYLVVCSTHTHAGPDAIGIWGPLPRTGVNRDYLAKVRKNTLEVLARCVAAEQPATLRIARTEIPELVKDSRLPKVIDQSVWTILADDAGGKAIATLTNWGIHPEVLDSDNTLVSADFPGVLRDAVRAERGGVAIHISGAVGGLTAPAFPDKDDLGKAFDAKRNRRVSQFGLMAARRVLASLATAQPLGTGVSFRTAEIKIPVNNALYIIGFGLGTIKRSAMEMVPIVNGRAPDPPAFLKTEVGLLRLGDAAIAMIPGEIYPELVVGGIQTPQDPGADHPGAPHEPLINTAMGDAKFKLVFGLANDEVGYLIPRSQWDNAPPYCYGRKSAQYGEENSCGPAAAAVVCEAFAKLAAK